jgi:hypothetical protein
VNKQRTPDNGHQVMAKPHKAFRPDELKKVKKLKFPKVGPLLGKKKG